MHLQCLVAAATLVGCGKIGFGTIDAATDSAGEIDAPTEVCVLGPWSTAVPATSLNSAGDDVDSAIHPDGTYVVFARRPTAGTYDLYGATVFGTQFGTPVALATLNTTADDEGPAWSPDGTTLYVVSSRSGTLRLYTSTFDGTSFTTPVQVSSLASVVMLGPHVATNDVELYYTASPTSPELHRATRSAPADAWADQGPIAELASASSEGYATLSADGRTVHFDSARSGVRSIWTATRAQFGTMFGTPSIVSELNAPPALTGDPDLRRDGRLMLFSSTRTGSLAGFNLWFSTRTCL